LAKDPDQRLASAAELAQALAAVKTSAGVSNLWTEQDVVVRAPSPSRTGPSRRTIAIAASVLLALVGGIILLAIILMETDKGTLIVEVDGDADVRFKNGELHIYDEKGNLKYTVKPSEKNRELAPGKYRVEVVGADGLKVDTPEFRMERD